MATFPCLGPPVPLLPLLLAITCLCHVTLCARILLIPLPDTSQCRQALSIGRELHARGHKVILFVPDYFRVRRCTEPKPANDVILVEFDTKPDTADYVSDRLERLGDEVMNGGTGLLGASRAARDVMDHVCSSYITESGDDLDELKLVAGGKIDFVLLDGSPIAHCLTLIPAYLGVPFAAVGSYIDPYDSNSPIPTAYYPAPLSGLGSGSGMGFFQRLQNFLTYASMHVDLGLFGGFHQGNALGANVGKLDPRLLIRKASLYLENSDHVVDYPRALFPNFLQVGGLTTSPSNPLPGALARFFDGAGNNGVIVVSLGPFVFTPNKNLEDKMLGAFRQLNARVLLRLNASRSGLAKAKNVQAVSWFPQNDALGHPNTKLFISHCGKNSFFEALYHGVPLLCCSFAGSSDVLGTGQRVAEYGVGLSMDLTHATADQIVKAVQTILNDKAMSRRIKAASKMFHSRGGSPVERAASAVEYVLKYGATYLRPRSVDMTFFQHTGLDIALFLFVANLVAAAVAGVIVYTQVLPRLHKHREQSAAAATDSITANSVASSSIGVPPSVTVLRTQSGSSVGGPLTRVVMYSLLACVVVFYIFV